MATDSTASDDDIPPPLPRKAREVDYSNLSDKDNLAMSDYSSPIIINNIVSCCYSVKLLFNYLHY